MSEPEPATADLFASISPTSHPLVARYVITLVKGATITVEFGTTTAYGRSTAPVPAPPGGGPASFLIAGMTPSTTYHLRARIHLPDGKWLTGPDQIRSGRGRPSTGSTSTSRPMSWSWRTAKAVP